MRGTKIQGFWIGDTGKQVFDSIKRLLIEFPKEGI